MAFKATYRRGTFKKKGRTVRTPAVPGLKHERSLMEEGAGVVVGIDEVGVGAWAGPVFVGAVALDTEHRLYKVRDSKLLDPARREWLSDRVMQHCLAWSVGMSWPEEIDSWGLSEAIRRAAARAIAGLPAKPDAFLLDGNWNYVKQTNTRVIVRGDCESLSIASASVVAKVARDRLMADLSALYPPYSFASNKGYPSPAHKWALRAFGPSPIHRRLFEPVRALFEDGGTGRLLTS